MNGGSAASYLARPFRPCVLAKKRSGSKGAFSQILEEIHFGANRCRACIRTRANTGKKSWRIIYVLVSCQGVLIHFSWENWENLPPKICLIFTPKILKSITMNFWDRSRVKTKGPQDHEIQPLSQINNGGISPPCEHGVVAEEGCEGKNPGGHHWARSRLSHYLSQIIRRLTSTISPPYLWKCLSRCFCKSKPSSWTKIGVGDQFPGCKGNLSLSSPPLVSVWFKDYTCTREIALTLGCCFAPPSCW